MGFLEYLFDFFKRVGFFIVGIVLMFMAGVVGSIGSKRGTGVLPTIEYNTVSSILGIIVFLVGLAMILYAWKRRD